MGAIGLVTLFKPGSVPYRGMETSTGQSTLSSIQHTWSKHGTDWQLRLPNKIMSLKKERLYRKRYTDSIKKEGLFSFFL